MKRIMTLIAFLVAVSVTPASADDDNIKLCRNYARLARVIMESRQAGRPAARLYELCAGNDMCHDLVILAYSAQRYHSEAMVKRAIGQFSDDAFIACISTMREIGAGKMPPGEDL